jgi:hypothetical protein
MYEAWLSSRCGRQFAAVMMKRPSRSVSTTKPRPSRTLTTDRRQSSNACDMVISRYVANDHGAGPVGAEDVWLMSTRPASSATLRSSHGLAPSSRPRRHGRKR